MPLNAGEAVESAPAKINLALHILCRRPDGYHELDSLVAFVPGVADMVRITPAMSFALEVAGPQAAGVPVDASNLALRAAQALHNRWPSLFPPVRIRLEKRLPVAAGIGGGSADAAAVMRAMYRLFGGDILPTEELHALALELGADVPVCLHGRAVRMRGIGERLKHLDLPKGLAVVLVNPGVQVSTAHVFARLAQQDGFGRRKRADGLPPVPQAADPEEFVKYLHTLRNDLEPPARNLAPAIADCLAALSALQGAHVSRMSGSGATCFALFANQRQAAVALNALRARHPHWWCAMGMLR